MPKKESGIPRSVRTGIFVILGMALFGGALFVLGARKQLFQKQVTIYAIFDDVAGLQEGAFVHIAGINVGTVSAIALPDSLGHVRVALNIRNDARQQIREDSRAVIGTEGLIGQRIVIVTQGSPHEKIIPPGGTILGQSPIRLYEFRQDIDQALRNLPDIMLNVGVTLASMRSIMERMNRGQGTIGQLLTRNTLHDSLVRAVSQISRLAMSTRHMVNTAERQGIMLSEEYGALAESLQVVSSDMRHTGHQINTLIATVLQGHGTLGRLITDDSLYVVMTHMTASGDTMLTQASAAIGQISKASFAIANAAQQASATIQQITDDVREGHGTIGQLVTNDSAYVQLNRILQNLQIASEKAAVDMEAIRSNWLFRGYFEQQGYWDNMNRKVELQEQRAIRLRDWQDRLERLQSELEQQERELEKQSNAPLKPVESGAETPSGQKQ